MKKLVVKDKTGCMACLECVRACSEAFYKEFDPDKSCIQIVTGKDGNPKPNTCIQCGKCMRTCKHGAITQNAKGVYMINKKLCTGCGECVEVCPMKVMVKVEASPVASKCIACGICAKPVPWTFWRFRKNKETEGRFGRRNRLRRLFLFSRFRMEGSDRLPGLREYDRMISSRRYTKIIG